MLNDFRLVIWIIKNPENFQSFTSSVELCTKSVGGGGGDLALPKDDKGGDPHLFFLKGS